MMPAPQRENKTLAQTIDESVIATEEGASALQLWFSYPRGPYMPFFEVFYVSFVKLVTLTSPLAEMREKHKELIQRCRGWIAPVEMKGDKNEAELARIECGISLWQDYYDALNDAGVITLRK